MLSPMTCVSSPVLTPVVTNYIIPSHSSHALNNSFYGKAHASSKDHGRDVDFDMIEFCALKARATSL